MAQLQTSAGEFRLQVRVVKIVVSGYTYHPSQKVQQPRHIISVKQYCLLGGHDEIRATIQELEKVQVLYAPLIVLIMPLCGP